MTLTEENRKIKEQLIWDFKNTKIKADDINKNIVKLIAEMVTEGIQLSMENKGE